MNILDIICKRKSVRTYTGENITEEKLNKILKSANASPVGMAQYENMHITIIKNKELLKEIDEFEISTIRELGYKAIIKGDKK